MNEEMTNNELYKEFETYFQSKFGDRPIHEIQEAASHIYIRFVILLNDIYDRERGS